MSRMTVAQVASDVAALAEVVASMNNTLMTLVPVVESLASAPAKVTAPAPARKKTTPQKAAAKKVAPKPAPKGAQSVETLSRKDWNRTLTTKARFAGGDAYKRVLDGWAIAQDMRAKGATPDAALEALTAR